MSISFFREKNSWLTKIILILLAITFALGFGYFGVVNLGNTGVSTGTAAEVNGEKIPLVQFYNVRENLYKQFGAGQRNLPPEALQFIDYRALQQLVEAKLMAQEARKLGFFISNDELSEAIRTNPNFQYDGKFIGLQAYRNVIRQALNMSVGDFEKGYREELLVQKMISLISSSAKLTDDELYNLYKMENENVSLFYITFNAEDFVNSGSISDSDIQDYFNKNEGEFLTEEKRKIEFAKITKEDFNSKIQISDDEVKTYYESYGDEFKDDDGNLKPLDEVRQELAEKLKTERVDAAYNEFVQSVLSNKQIPEINQFLVENSLPESSQSEYFSRDQELEEIPNQIRVKTFTLEKGDTDTLPVSGDLWVFQLIEIEPQRQKTLDESRDDVIKVLSMNKGGEAAKIAAQETLNKINSSKASFKDSGESLDLEVKQTDLFPRTSPPENLNVENLNIDAFLLSESSPNGSKIYQNGNSYFIISLKDKSNADIKDFEKEKDEIRTRQLQRQQSELINEWINKLREESEIVPNPNLFSANN